MFLVCGNIENVVCIHINSQRALIIVRVGRKVSDPSNPTFSTLPLSIASRAFTPSIGLVAPRRNRFDLKTFLREGSLGSQFPMEFLQLY